MQFLRFLSCISLALLWGSRAEADPRAETPGGRGKPPTTTELRSKPPGRSRIPKHPFLQPASLQPSAPTLHLTLSRAIQLALEKNLSIQVEAFEPRIAGTKILSQEGAFDPELRAGFEHDMVRNADNSTAHTGNFSSGIGGLTPLGSSYGFGLSTAASNYHNFQAGASFSLNQPLLRGFGTDVNLANLRIARNDRRVSEWAFRQQVIDVVTRTVFVYNALYSALRDYEASVRSRDAALQLQRDEERRMEIGVKTALDVTTARAEAASREEAVSLAHEAIRENERFLKQVITDDTETLLDTRVEIETPPTAATGPIDVKAGLREALSERPDYREALIQLQNQHIQVVVSRNETLPRLDLAGSLNLLGVATNDVFNSVDAMGDGSREPSGWTAGLVFRMPFPNRSARGKLAGAKLQDAQALVSLQRLEQEIVVEVANAADQIMTAHERIEITGEAVRLAKESLTAGEERLKVGAATTFEVLELQRKLMQAEAAQIKAEGDYRTSIANYDQKTGTTLERNAIRIAQ